ncbi:hypothetical protein SLS56_003568 [Neofusicoccum ribis]|uniref:Peptidase A2 domain-containing protein n=1 Tax=Neofusicoccum ribis TaxID=45134 RepID=A0ABR3SYS0_9PEZI
MAISAFPDSGSGFNIISKDLVSELGSRINKSGRQLLRLPQGKVWSLGTVSLPFRFKDERTCYPLNFHVMEECVHSCVLGSKFLKATKTLTKYLAKRVTSRMVDIASLFRNRVCLLGSSQERLLGSVNGQAIGALADTGAYVNVISRSSAEQLGLEIKDGKDYRTELQFMDGSVASTSGMTLDVEWKFGTTGESPSHRLNFHVLENLPCDLILCENFLFENDVFSLYEDLFYDHVSESNLLVEIAFIGFPRKTSKESQTKEGQRDATIDQKIDKLLLSRGQNIAGQVDEHPQVQTQPQAQTDGSHGESEISSDANGQGQTPDSNATQNVPRQKRLRILLLFRKFRRA